MKNEAKKREALSQLARLHRKAVAKAVPTIKQALAILGKLRGEVRSVKTYDALRQIIQVAEALKILLGEIIEVKRESEAIVLLANMRIGQEIATVKKATGPHRYPSQKVAKRTHSGRGDIGVTRTSSSRLQKLAKLEEEKLLKLAQELWDAGKDATVRAIVSEIREKDIKKSRADYLSRADKGANVADLEQLAKDGKTFAVIYADPPWEFKVYSGKGKQRSAERHYDTKGLEKIKALPVATVTEKDCALFLWCVMPELPGALEVIKAWGFEYKTVAFVWVKQNRKGRGLFTGMGYWTRANAEMVLFATKGSPTRIEKDVHSIILSPVGRHSEKPEEAWTRIQRLLNGPYLELYGRKPRPGCTVWGNEITKMQEAAE